MTAEDPKLTPFSLKRWSQKKLEAAHAPEVPSAPAPATVTPPDAGAVEPAAPIVDAAPLPPIESLTIDSDFSAFFEPTVDEALRQRALRQLFRDPHFNVMDGLDVYVGDYSTPDPISPEMVRTLVQGRYVFDPPKTRVNASGAVEDVPADDAAAEPAGPVALPDSARVAPVIPTPNPATHDAAEPEPAAGSPPAGPEPASR